MKKLFRILVTLLVAISLVACSNGGNGGNGGNTGAEKTKVVMWNSLTDHDAEVTQEIIDAFNASQEKWEVEQVAGLDNKTISAKVYEAVTNGTGPNLVWLFPNTATEYVGDGLALDFGKYLTDADFKDRVPKVIYDVCTDYVDGQLHAIAGTQTGPIMFYNGALLEKYGLEIPQTWEELLTACKTVVDGEKAEGKDIIGFGPDSIDTLGIIALHQLGLHFIDGNNTANEWTDQKYVDWLNWWKEAEDQGYFKIKDPEGYHSGPFGNVQYFCYMGSNAGLGYITPQGFDIVCGPVPQMGNGIEYTESTLRALVGFTSEDEAANEGAAQFAAFFVKPENFLNFVKTYNANSPYLDINETQEYKDYQAANIANAALGLMSNYASVRKAAVGGTAAQESLVRALENIIINGADAVETLTAEQAVANAALSGN